MKTLELLHGTYAAIAAIFFLVAWRRSRFYLPSYIHVIAAIAFVLGCVSIYALQAPSIPAMLNIWWLPFVLVAFVYATFVLKGGAHAAASRRPDGPDVIGKEEKEK